MNDSFTLFLTKIDAFKRRYYLQKLLVGVVKTILYSVAIIFVLSVAESFFTFSSNIRLLFYLTIIIFLFVCFIYLILLPFLCLTNLLSGQTNKYFALIIQSAFSKTKDILINIIELSELESSSLVRQSINQKVNEIKDIDFNSIISFNILKDKKIVLFFSILFILYISFFRIISDGFSHILNYSEEFSDQKSISVRIDESLLKVEQGTDFYLNLVIENANSQDAFILINNNKYILNHENDSIYSFLFKNVNNSFKFNILIKDFVSKQYNVSVFELPIISSYFVDIHYPNYVNKPDTLVHNQNILNVPQGTFLNFNFTTSNADSLFFYTDSLLVDSVKMLDNKFSRKLKIYKNTEFSIFASNANIKRKSLDFKIIAIPDNYPVIAIIKTDTAQFDNMLSFFGKITDDYGFTKLLFYAKNSIHTDTIVIPIYKNLTSQQFFCEYEIENLFSFESNNNEFWFEVYDNDAVNGYKKTVSKLLNYSIKNVTEKLVDKENQYESLFEKFYKVQNLSNEIKSDIDNLRRSMLNNNLSDWEKQSLLNQISEKTKQLNENISLINREYKQATNTLTDNNLELLEKQKLIDEMLNSLLDDEMKQMLEEIQKLASETNNQNISPEDLKNQFDNFQKMVDQQYELVKKMKIEENLENLANSFEMLSNQHKNLIDSISDYSKQSIEKHEQIFEDLKKEYEKVMNDNQELTRPYEIDDLNDEFKQIEKEFNNEKSISEQNQLRESIKNNSDNLKKLSERIKENLDTDNSAEATEDANNLRQLLDNLFEVSYNIEDIYNSMISNKLSQDYILQQTILIDNFKIVRDSLYALSQRTPYLSNQILKAAFLIEDNMIAAMQSVQQQNLYKANKNQREALMKTNDMILLLSESLKNLNNAAGVGTGGKNKTKQKKNPQDSKQSLSDMRKTQEKMKTQLKDLLNQMKSDNEQNLNQELAKMLMHNEMYQQMLQQLMYNSDIDSKTSKLLQEIKNLMETNRKDVVNKQISAQTMLRQQRIVTKLLEAENAENEREKEEKRESKIAKNINRKTPNNLPEEIIFDSKSEMLDYENIRLNSFYKAKFEEYINQLNTQTNE